MNVGCFYYKKEFLFFTNVNFNRDLGTKSGWGAIISGEVAARFRGRPISQHTLSGCDGNLRPATDTTVPRPITSILGKEV